MEIIFHYPPDLLNLLIDGIPLLCRSKKDLILFFRGAGISPSVLYDLSAQVDQHPNGIKKYEIVRTVLTRLNEKGEAALGERREVLRRVVEFEDFSTCWPEDQLKAKGLVSEIRRVVNVKDSFTRMKEEREREADGRRQEQLAKQRRTEERRRAIDEVRNELGGLLARTNPQKRGTDFEKVLNRLFTIYGISVRESFRVVGEKGAGVIEQIDGVVELAGDIYLVEMKWIKDHIDINDVSRHLIRIYHRGSTRGLFVSVTDFTEAALRTCREALQNTVLTLCLLEEIVSVLEEYGDLSAFLRQKIRAAQIDKKPFVRLRLKAGSSRVGI